MIDPAIVVGSIGVALVVLGVVFVPWLLAAALVVTVAAVLGAWWLLHTWSERNP